LKPGANEPKVWFPSKESFARVLSEKSQALLATIAETHPGSMQELAEQTDQGLQSVTDENSFE